MTIVITLFVFLTDVTYLPFINSEVSNLTWQNERRSKMAAKSG